MTGRIRAGLVPAALLLVLGAVPARCALPEAAGEPWVEVRTARFSVYSNAGEAVATRSARHLERLADVIERTTGGLATDGRRLVRVFVFKDRDSFRPYEPFGGGETSASAGFHIVAEDVEMIATFGGDPTNLSHFLAHEYLHVVLSRSLGSVPVWLGEGLAELYSTFEAKGQQASIGGPIASHVRWLREHMLTSHELFSITLDSRSYQEGDRRGTIYAQSWGLVHLLYFDRDTTERFDRLMREVARGRASEDAVRHVYGPAAPDSLARALRTYMSFMAIPSLSWKFEQPFDAVQARSRVVTRPELLSLLGEVLAGLGPRHIGNAREHLEAAWGADSAASVPAGLLARLADTAGDSAGTARWEAAVRRRAPADPRGSAILGGHLSRRRLEVERFLWPAGGVSPLALRARSLIEPMLDARPDVLEWLVPYAFTFLEEKGDVSRGLGSLVLAEEARRHNTEREGALCILQVRAGQLGAAEKLFDEISPGPDQDFWRERAGGLIARARLDSVPVMLRQGRIADADSLAARIGRRLPEAGVLRVVARMRAEIREYAARLAEQEAAKPPGAASRKAGSRGNAGAGNAQGPGGGAPASTESRLLAAARESMRKGEYETAERLYRLELEGARSASQRARLDSLATNARNLRRLEAADELGGRGRRAEACTLLELVLEDRPSPQVKRSALEKKRRYCGR